MDSNHQAITINAILNSLPRTFQKQTIYLADEKSLPLVFFCEITSRLSLSNDFFQLPDIWNGLWWFYEIGQGDFVRKLVY